MNLPQASCGGEGDSGAGESSETPPEGRSRAGDSTHHQHALDLHGVRVHARVLRGQALGEKAAVCLEIVDEHSLDNVLPKRGQHGNGPVVRGQRLLLVHQCHQHRLGDARLGGGSGRERTGMEGMSDARVREVLFFHHGPTCRSLYLLNLLQTKATMPDARRRSAQWSSAGLSLSVWGGFGDRGRREMES